MNKQLVLLFLICSGFFLTTPVSASQEDDDTVYTFGVVPQFDSRRIHAIWQPILEEIQQRTGLKFTLKGSSNIPEFEKEFARGVFDFAYMNPYHILMANNKQGYQPLLKDEGRDLYGIVVVRKDSPINKMEELEGKLIAFPSANALGASLMPRAAFLNIYKININPKYVKTHSSVYLNVALGEADAGGGVQKTLEQQSPELRDKLKVLYETKRVSPHPISVHPRVTDKVKQQVAQAFLNMALTEKGNKLLAGIPIKKIGPATMQDYEPVDALGLETVFIEH